ncbi:MAG: hypothetical protein CVV64_14410 [Candidatus Wallbacteria bacterium HGW-Wallbacteria-1]|uniref:Uncharacterized protein n=1 Tax=Candidatus Wallbacteria bacterium HGW-Wallbacteria-1 TaxID=2013854 RepID=A0A2N1PM34_9BACT|nr:MAG: hypothetical protein CVV64_14410 [Candidatus Wallbacteria bacterium HGW-Wallbacteria-1]
MALIENPSANEKNSNNEKHSNTELYDYLQLRRHRREMRYRFFVIFILVFVALTIAVLTDTFTSSDFSGDSGDMSVDNYYIEANDRGIANGKGVPVRVQIPSELKKAFNELDPETRDRLKGMYHKWSEKSEDEKSSGSGN